MDRVIDRILIVDTEASQRDLLVDYLSNAELLCTATGEADVALDLIGSQSFDFLLISDRVQGHSPLDFIKKVYARSPDTFVIYMSDKIHLGGEVREFQKRFRRLPWPPILEDLLRTIRLNSSNIEAG